MNGSRKKKANIYTRTVNNFMERWMQGIYAPIYVIEYPKCGGTWLARILRSYFGVSREAGLSKPLCRNAVLQKHSLPRPWQRKPVIIVRDPRDVWVSLYFHMIRQPGKKIIEQARLDPSAPDRANMLIFIDHVMNNPGLTSWKFDYVSFVRAWSNVQHACWIRYEDMHASTVDAVSSLLLSLKEPKVDGGRLENAVEENSFKRITGRDVGVEDPGSHKRKGIVGDWKNYLDGEILARIVREQEYIFDKFGYEHGA